MRSMTCCSIDVAACNLTSYMRVSIIGACLEILVSCELDEVEILIEASAGYNIMLIGTNPQLHLGTQRLIFHGLVLVCSRSVRLFPLPP